MEENKELLRDIFRLIKKNVCNSASFLYPVCAMLSFIPEETGMGKGVLSTDGINIYYCPEEVLELYKERRLSQIERELLHILLHGMLGHFGMWQDVGNQELFDLCADMEAEQLMVRLKLNRRGTPGGRKQETGGGTVRGCRKMYAQYLQQINTGQANLDGIKRNSEAEDTDNHQRWKQNGQKENIRRFWAERLQEAFPSAKNKEGAPDDIFDILANGHGNDRGDGKNAGSQKLKDSSEGSFSFAGILKEILELDESAREEEEQFDKGLYQYGFDTYGDIALLEPSDETEDKQRLDTIIIAIDTSGSCAGDLVKKFFRETRKLFREIRESYTVNNIVVMQCDNAIREEKHYTSIDDFLRADEMILKGFGGTDFRPVFKRAEQIAGENNVKSLIYFSDGEGDFPREEASFQTAFIMDVPCDYRGMVSVPKWVKAYYFNETEVEEC